MTLEFIKLVKGDSPVAEVGSYGFFKLGVESGGGGDLVTFANATPEQISIISAEISANNLTVEQVAETYGWNLGDTTKITLTTGEVIEVRIIDFNHDVKSDGSGKAGITLQMTHCLATTYPAHTYDKYTSWEYCTMRTSALPEIKKTLPNEWQSIIKKVNKKQVASQYSDAKTMQDELFLLSEYELWGRLINAPASIGTKEGSTQYSYWANRSKVMMRDTDGDGVPDTSTSWMLRTMHRLSSNAQGFCAVTSAGASGYHDYTSQSIGVSFAFCV